MNDEKFELTISDLAGSGTYYADIADELRARDTAQREALARVEAERDAALAHGNHQVAGRAWAMQERDTTQAQLDEAVQYRLLRVGEIIQATDEVLRDDCVTWTPMGEDRQLGIGWKWHEGLMPMRRANDAMPAQADEGGV
ncbi:hypothetical protein [Pseudomonas oryzihabitans]|uniref:hypothetical protein n=1 Tax=Pseudomonas oryzihabitans TaxID=47885 RepID=UPI00289431A5|nr:hypothetical protein [Pseudomonas oryzihabitans]MDT3718478.1 hypothetical protein [Pseudomonas oryzihabitans]